MIEHYLKLRGRTITAIVQDIDQDIGVVYGLQLDNGDIAWIMCDPEGNGPGFLDIQKEVKHDS